MIDDDIPEPLRLVKELRNALELIHCGFPEDIDEDELRMAAGALETLHARTQELEKDLGNAKALVSKIWSQHPESRGTIERGTGAWFVFGMNVEAVNSFAQRITQPVQAREAKDHIAQPLEMVAPVVLPEPVSKQFQDKTGAWCNFINKRHEEATVAAGDWPIRNLYTEQQVRELLTGASAPQQQQQQAHARAAWSGWACQYPGKMPRLYGAREIAELNCDAENGDQLLFLSECTAPPPQAVRQPWLLYLSDRADGVAGHFAIARWNPAGYREVWNLRAHSWSAFSDETLTLEQAQELLKQVVLPTAPVFATSAELFCESCGPKAVRRVDGEALPDRLHEAPQPQADALDAARYRWLIDYLISDRVDLDDAIGAARTSEDITKVIDAAIAAQEGGAV